MQLPARLGKYELEKLLGGGMSKVYRARDTVIGRTVAVKILSAEACEDAEAKARFVTEARIAGNLSHENVLSIYDFGEDEQQRPFIVMEFLLGENLGGAIKNSRTGDLNSKLKIAVQVARALLYIHSQKIIHRDLKPENVHLGQTGVVKLMDFGIAKTEGLSLTRAGSVFGTPHYMAPEQVTGKGVTGQVDVYAFGALLFELLTGTKPILGDTVERIFWGILYEPIDLERLRVAGAPGPICNVVARCMAKDPADRPQGFGEIVAAIEQALTSLPEPGEFTRMLQATQSPVQPARVPLPSRMASALTEFTQMFRTAPAPPNPTAPPDQPAAPSNPQAASAGTQLFYVPNTSRSADPAASRDALEEVPADVALTITACADHACIGKTVRVTGFPFCIGRTGALSFDSAISREHAELQFTGGGFFIQDFGSANGTFVNGKRLLPGLPEPLLFGSRILLGANTQLTFVSNDLEELPDLTGVVIGGRYRLSARLFASAKSAVYIADHRDLEGRAAVKILSPRLARHPGYREQFEHEAKMASGLRHDSIARVFDYGETELGPDFPKSVYLVTEYFDGGNLLSRLGKEEQFDLGRVARWLDRLARALDYIHGKQVIHGGIKPTSIVFDSSDNPYLSDFASAVTASDRTHRTLIGSPPFLAPEQWEGKDLAPATDQYSLAALFYRVVAGAHPYEGQEHPEVRKRNYLRPPAPAHEMAAQNLRPAVPPAVSPVLRRALAVNLDERFPSAEEFAAAFRSALVEKPASAHKKPSVFVSYHRGGSLPLALLIKAGLEGQHECEVFVDVMQRDAAGGIPEYLARSIDRSDVFVCLLTRNTLNSTWVNTEIELAYKAAKPMVPVFQENFRHPRDLHQQPEHLRKLLLSNGAKLYDRQGEYISAAIQRLSDLIRQSMPGQ